MTERNTSSERLSERDVERLLQKFFVGETPAEFRREDVPVMLSQSHLNPIVSSTTSDTSRSLAGILGILVSATCCLIVTLFMPSAPQEEPRSATSTSTSLGENHRGGPHDDRPVPIEERSHLPFISTGGHSEAPPSDTESTDALGPELEIEIFPLRTDQPRE